jgi:MFS family permease
MATEQQQNTSTWLALKNRVFVGLWIASLVSGCCVSAHDTAATWLMNSLGASPLLLSLMATSASLPFFLFTLPAGAIADLVNRQKLFIGTYLWLAEVPQLSQHALAFKRLCGQVQAIFSTTFSMIFGDVGSAKPKCASSSATGLSGRATRRMRS